MNLIKKHIKDVKHLIPQKFPFVMVDTLCSFTAENLISSFTILDQNIFLQNNQLSASGLIENMAQSVALHTGYDYFLKNEPAPIGYIGSIKKITINELPNLNDIITTEVKILQEFMGITMVEIEVYNSRNELIASGNMKTVIAKNE